MQVLLDKLNVWVKLCLLFCILLFAATGCTSAPPVRTTMQPVHYRMVSQPPVSFHPKVQSRRFDTYSYSEIYRRIYRESLRWEGTPHRMGGTSRNGVDCSGFVMTLYQKLFQIRLPRTTKDQVRLGQWVSKDGLKPGDLVFFHPPKKRCITKNDISMFEPAGSSNLSKYGQRITTISILY